MANKQYGIMPPFPKLVAMLRAMTISGIPGYREQHLGSVPDKEGFPGVTTRVETIIFE